MNLTVFSVLTSLALSILCIVSFNVAFNRFYLRNIDLRFLLFLFLAPLIRIFLPFEFWFTKEITIHHLYPSIYEFFKSQKIFLYIVCFIWLIGAIKILFHEFNKYYKIQRAFNHTLPCQDKRIACTIQQLLPNRKVKRICIKSTSAITAPMIFGLIKPTIVLPASINLNDAHDIIAHEVGHYVNGDLYMKWVIEFIAAIYWWLPMIGRIKQNIYNIMEIRADFFVLKGKNIQQRKKYLQILLSFAKNETDELNDKTIFVSCFAQNSLSIKKRFEAISSANFESDKKRIHNLALMVITIAIIAPIFVIQPRFDIPDESVELFAIDKHDYYFTYSRNGSYDLYHNQGGFIVSVSHIPKNMDDIPIY